MKTKLECYQQLTGVITLIAFILCLGGISSNDIHVNDIGVIIIFGIGYLGSQWIEHARREE